MGYRASAGLEASDRPRHRAEIDGLRALAVLGVVYFHAVVPTAARAIHTPLEAIGSRGVDLFFVLSGFCLSLPLTPAKMRSTGDYLTFVRRRFTRIAPTFYVALALFAALAWTPFGLPNMTGPVSMADQKADVLRDALFFQSLKPMHDVPMWTLGIEARWYILFPLLFILLHRTRIGFAIAMLGAAWLYRSVGVYDFGFLPTFMLGIVAAQLVKSESKFHAWWPPIAAVLSALAVLTQLHSTAMDHTDLLWALASFALLLAVTTNPQLRRVFSWGPLVTVGLASYSIYLVHMPFLDSLVWAGVPSVVAAIASVAIGFVFWLCVERPLCSRACRTALDAFLVRGYHAMTLGRARVAVRAPSPSSAVAAD